MAHSAKSHSKRRGTKQRVTSPQRPPIRSPSAAPVPAEVQKRLGNRGAMAFAEQSFGAEGPASITKPGSSDPSVTKLGAREEAPVQKEQTAEVQITEAGAPTPTKDDSRDVATPAPSDETPESDEQTKKAPAEGVTLDGPSAEQDAAVVNVGVVADSPGGIMQQLVAAPPTQSMQAYGQAGELSGAVLQKQTEQAQSELPEMPAPTGISSTTIGDVVKGQIEQGVRPPQKLEGEQGGRDTRPYPTAVNAGPPAPAPRPTVLRGGAESNTEGGDRELSLSAQNALNNIRIFTGEISDSAGPRPGVDVTGDADPSQMDAFRASSDSSVTDAANVARQDTYKDFGENAIFPQETTEILSSNRQLSTTRPPSEAVEPPVLPADIASALNESTGPIYREKVGAQRDEYVLGEADYEQDKLAAHDGANKDIVAAESATQKEQLQQREGTQRLVAGYRKEWREELDAIDADYRGKADRAGTKHRGDIEKKRIEGESKAEAHLVEAEKKVARKKLKAKEDVRREKAKKRKKSGGFWGWAKRAASALVDVLKKAVNFIYDQLRKLVKGIFELAKKLARAAIELARMAIVGLIKVFGAVLKGFVSIALAAFPDTAKKINTKIDGAVNTAVDTVNAAAEALKSAVSAILDFLASTIDSLLGLIQKIYNGIFTVIGMIIRGEFGELLRRLGYLVKAARMAPSRFETAAYEELLGGNLDEPLSPVELAQAGITPKTNTMGAATQGHRPTPPWSKQNVGVDSVDNNMQLSPELVAQLLSTVSADGVAEFGESADKQRSMESIMQEAHGGTHSEAPGTTGKQGKNPPDGLTPTQRAQAKWKIMKNGLSKWWQDNKVLIIAGTVAAIVGVIAAIILSGGAILGAIPPIMSVLGPIFIGASIAAIATRVGDYVSQSWEGNVKEGSKSLAKGLAAGAIEIISWLTFKAGGAVLKGGKAVVKSGAKAFQKARSGISKMAMSSGKAMISRGKVLFKGVANSGIGKRAKSLRELGERFLKRTRFRKFRITRTGYRFSIEGFVNPWILLATGKIKKVSQEDLVNMSKRGETARVGHKVRVDGEDAIVIGSKLKKKKSTFVKKLDDPNLDDAIRQADYDELTELGMKARINKIKGSKGFDFEQAKKEFGVRVATALKNRDQLRAALKMGDSAKEAHHVLPAEALKQSPALQRAVKAGFKFNGSKNGVPLSKYSSKTVSGAKGRHASHPNYTKRIMTRLAKLDTRLAKGNLTPAQAKEEVAKIAKEIKDKISKSSGKIDDLQF